MENDIDNKDVKNINIDIDIKDDLVCRYSDKTVSKDLIEFLIDRIADFRIKDTVKIIINKNKNIGGHSIKLIKEGLKKEHKNSLEETQKNNLKQIWLFCIGLILIFLANNMDDINIWKQVLIIIGWVPIWEAVEMELFPDVIARKRRRYIKKLLECEMTERVINKIEVEEIQISKGEELKNFKK